MESRVKETMLHLISPNSFRASQRSPSVTPSTRPRTWTTTDGSVLCGSSYPWNVKHSVSTAVEPPLQFSNKPIIMSVLVNMHYANSAFI